MLSLETYNRWKKRHHLNIRIVVRRTTTYHTEQKLSHRNEEQSDEERHYMGKKNKRQSEPEFFLIERVADVDDVEYDQNAHEYDEVQKSKKSFVVDAR